MRKLYAAATSKCIALFVLLLFVFTSSISAQNVTVNPGGGSYATLKDAFDAINAGTHTGAVTITIDGNTTETASAVLNASGSGAASYTSIIITPNGARSITGAVTNHLIDLNGADNVIIDGLNTGGNSLTIENTSNTATATTIRFVADATMNTIQNTTIKGSGTSTTLGTIFFSTGTTTGNDGNSILNNEITSSGSTFATNAIYSAGTSAAIDNQNTITGNNISNNFNVASISIAINLGATGNSGWTISNNKIFQTSTRRFTTGVIHSGIFVGGGSGYTITGNTIGFANASGTGTTNFVGSSADVVGFPGSFVATGTANATRYVAINCAFTAGGTVSNIQGNTVAGIALYTSSGASTTTGVLCGIAVTSGNVNIGTTTGNTIGVTTGQSSLYAVATTAGAVVTGIHVTSVNIVAIQNNNLGGIDVSGTTASTAAGFRGIDVAGAAGVFTITDNSIGNATANNIRTGLLRTGTNLSNVATTPETATGTSAVTAIASSATGATLNINNNTLRGIQVSGSATAVTGISNSGAITTTINLNNNLLGTATTGFVTYAVANSGALTGILNSAGATGSTLNINNNNVRGITHSAVGSSAHTYISNTTANPSTNINNNTFTALNVNTTGGVTFIGNNVTHAANTVHNANNNSITTSFNKAGAGGTVTFFSAASSSPNTVTKTANGNNFSNITVTGATTIAGWASNDGGSPVQNVANNIFNNITGGTSDVTILRVGFGSAGLVTGNTVSNITSAGSIVGITSSSGTQTFTANTVSNISSSGASAVVSGMSITGGTSQTVNGNTISGLSGSGATSPVIHGILISSGTLSNVFGNKIYNLSQSGAISTTNGAVNGITVSGGTTINVYNNLVGSLTAPAASLTDAIRGINVTSAAAGGTNRVYYNTVYLNASSSGTNFGTTGVFHTSNTTATVGTLDLRNNIIINLSTPAGTGVTAALRRSTAAQLANFATSSNNNLLYAGTPSTTRVILQDGATGYDIFGPAATAGTYQNYVSGRDIASFTGETFNYSTPGSFFISLTGSDADFLHLVAGITTQVEGGAAPITTPAITDDFDGQARSATKPDVGADEFVGSSPAPVITLNSISPSGIQCVASARNVSVNVTTPSGTITAVEIVYNVDGTPIAPMAMSNPSGTTWTATIPAATPGNRNVTWTITATNSLGVSTVYAGASYADEPLTGITGTATASLNTVCAGSPTILKGVFGTLGTVAIGTDNTTRLSTSGVPYRTGAGLNSEQRNQYLIFASELQAANLVAGDITALRFVVTTASPTGVMSNLTFKMANTNVSALTSTYLTPSFTTVLTLATYTPVSGDNNHTFTTPFTWDGVSNVLIEVCGKVTTSGSGVTIATFAATNSTVANTSTTGCTDATGTLLATQRPVLGLTGMIGPVFSSYSWSDGTNTVGTTNPLTVSPTVNTNYTVTATDANGCSITSAPIAINVTPLPSAPTGTNSTQCGVGVPQVSVATTTGATSPEFKWYSASTGGTLLQDGGDVYLTSVSSTTSFWVSEKVGDCESPRTQVTVTVNQPDAITAKANNSTTPATICPGAPVALTVEKAAGSNTYVYTWSATPDAGSGLPAPQIGATVNVNPDDPGTYVYTVTANDAAAQCNIVATVTVTVAPNPVVNTPTATATTICAGTSITLTATTNDIAAGTRTIGTDNAATRLNTDGVPYRTGAGDGATVRNQYLILASELTAAGIFPGNITSLAFTTTAATGSMSNWTLRLAHTSTTAMTTTFLTPTFTTVLVLPSYTPVVGANLHTFTTPFTWDGTSNIVVEVCGTVVTGSGSTMATFNSPTPASVTATTGCAAATGTLSTTNRRPVITFGAQVGTSGPGSLNWVWNPGNHNGNVYTVTPSTIGQNQYTVRGTNTTTGCYSERIIDITVNAIPTAPTATNSSQCGVAVPTASVTSTTGEASPEFKWYSASTGGTLLQDGNATYQTAINSTTIFWVSEKIGDCESPRTEVTVTVTQPDAVTAKANNSTTPAAICPGATVALTVEKAAGPRNYTYTWSATPDAGSGLPMPQTGATLNVAPTDPGTYVYTVTGTDAPCTVISTVTITVSAVPVINTPVATAATICAGGSVGLSVSAAPALLFSENFSGSASGWTTANLSTSEAVAGVTSWALRTSPYVGPGWTTISSNDNSQFYASNSAEGGSGNNTQVLLTSPSFSTVGYTSASLRFFNFYQRWNTNDTAQVQVSTDGGSNWTVINQYTATRGSATAWQQETIDLTPYVGQADVRIRFRYRAIWGYGWAIDNLNVTGTPTYSYSWASVPAGFTATGASVTANPAVTTTYTVTASDGTCTSTADVIINVTPLPSAPTATNSTQCGVGVPTASVASTTGEASPDLKWYDAATGGTLVQDGGTTFQGSVNNNISFWVSEKVGDCESPRTQVSITVNQPDALTAKANNSTTPTAVCPGATVALTVEKAAGPRSYTYTWSASPDAGSGLPVPQSGATLNVMPTEPGTYVYTVTGSDAPCTAISTVTVTVSPVPTVNTPTATASAICAGSNTTLTATTSSISTGSITIGTATTLTGATATPTAFINRWPSYRMQTIYTAAELQAAGLTAGNITSMSFNITTLGDEDFNDNYTVKIANTTLNSFAGAPGFVSTASGFTTVFPAATYTHAIGWNTINFSTPFNWNGTSNIVVEVMHDGADAVNNSQTYYTATSVNMVAHTTTAATNSASYSLNRLNVMFGGQVATTGAGSLNWIWNPGNLSGNSVTVNPTTPGVNTYTVRGTDAITGCYSEATIDINVTAIPSAPTATNSTQCGVGVPTASVTSTTGEASPEIKWYSASTGGTLLQDGGTTYQTAINTTTSFWVSEKIGDCESPRTQVTVTVNDPDAITAKANTSTTPAAVCPGATVALSVEKAAGSNTYSYTWTANPDAGSGLPIAQTGATLNVTPTDPGTYVYTVAANDAATQCNTVSTVTLVVSPVPVINTPTATLMTVCAGASTTLTATTNDIAAGTRTIGTDNAATRLNTDGVPYRTGAGVGANVRNQYLILASELTAAGIFPGNITSLAFTTTAATGSMSNWTLRLAHTSTAAMTTSFLSPTFTTVLVEATYSPVVGVNTHTFTTPFTWDGTSNILVEVCGTVASGSGSTMATFNSPTPASVTSTGGCAAATGTLSTLNRRPVITFGAQVGTTGAGSLNWVWNPGNLSGNSVTVSPSAPGVTTYTVRGTNTTTGCYSERTIDITNASAINASTVLAGTTGGAQVCASYDLSVSNTYFNNCELIATIVPSGASQISGVVNTCVRIDGSVQTSTNNEPYVQRHFYIAPVTNATTATSTITLYFTGDEFAAFNAARNGFAPLPTTAADPATANVRVTQFNSAGTTATLPSAFATGSGIQITPTSVTFDAGAGNGGRWAVTFNATGSGAFFVHTGNFTLPVTITNFKGEVSGSVNKLFWTTSTETNNRGFELERSADGINFNAVTFVATKADRGFSTFALSYNFDDVKPLAGNNYYRLKQIDNDGKYSYSTVVLLTRKINEITMSRVYPNPTMGSLNLVIESPKSERVTIVVTDLTGKILMQQPTNVVMGENLQQLNVARLAAGTYVVKAVCANGCETAVHRFVKQ